MDVKSDSGVTVTIFHTLDAWPAGPIRDDCDMPGMVSMFRGGRGDRAAPGGWEFRRTRYIYHTSVLTLVLWGPVTFLSRFADVSEMECARWLGVS